MGDTEAERIRKERKGGKKERGERKKGRKGKKGRRAEKNQTNAKIEMNMLESIGIDTIHVYSLYTAIYNL